MKLAMPNFSGSFGQIEVLKSYFDRLTQRERYIALGSAAIGLLLLLFLIFFLFSSMTSSLDKKIEKSRKDYEKIQDIKSDYAKTQTQVNQLERVIRRIDPNFRLATELERLAGKYSISIDSVKEVASTPNDLYQESKTSVAIKEVNIRTLLSYLHDIENSSQFMRITSLKIKPNFKDASLLNVDFVVSTFKLKDEA